MPYVGPEDARDQAVVRVADVVAEIRTDGGRVPLVGLPQARGVLLHWKAGAATVPHRHPRAVEMFIVIEGEVRAWFGDMDDAGLLCGPGTFMVSRPGEAHRFAVPGPGAVTLLVVVAPNEDRVDETIESVEAEALGRPAGSGAVKR